MKFRSYTVFSLVDPQDFKQKIIIKSLIFLGKVKQCRLNGKVGLNFGISWFFILQELSTTIHLNCYLCSYRTTESIRDNKFFLNSLKLYEICLVYFSV